MGGLSRLSQDTIKRYSASALAFASAPSQKAKAQQIPARCSERKLKGSEKWLENTKLLLVPVYCALLAAQRTGPQHPINSRLRKEHEESHPQQILMGQLLDPEFTLSPPQQVGSNACGCYITWSKS